MDFVERVDSRCSDFVADFEARDVLRELVVSNVYLEVRAAALRSAIESNDLVATMVCSEEFADARRDLRVDVAAAREYLVTLGLRFTLDGEQRHDEEKGTE